ncbi:hypothetical protein SCLCIDRAFT_298705 [Scleroderma citrinum Foug A]|uniref:Uncharacterized protein n=1 Tax=Scleroderma citrinum Foug A TaxID=1036808 RepID=A0A0C3DGC9_9AGAM|nr:hypothetical protein SCLCIDRAFT_298705 [Scleroderma citrinum Foug A]
MHERTENCDGQTFDTDDFRQSPGPSQRSCLRKPLPRFQIGESDVLNETLQQSAMALPPTLSPSVPTCALPRIGSTF